MRSSIRFLFVLTTVLISAQQAFTQSGEICGETGGGSVWLNTRAVYGRIVLKGVDRGARQPKVTVSLFDGPRMAASQTVSSSGNYCFRDTDGRGAIIVVEVEGVEVGRQVLSSGGVGQFQQDFEIFVPQSPAHAKPGAISAKYTYPRSGKNAELFEQAQTAQKDGKQENAIKLLKDLVAIDAMDFGAWSLLGSVYFERNDLSAAESAYEKALAAKPDLSIAMMNMGRIQLVQNKTDRAIEFLKTATVTDPTSARSFQLLGEAYLVARKGTLGVEALNEAIRLEPIEMAECHLLMARLYDLAGAKQLASKEYRMFLEKVPNHADRKKFAKYMKEHPEIPD